MLAVVLSIACSSSPLQPMACAEPIDVPLPDQQALAGTHMQDGLLYSCSYAGGPQPDAVCLASITGNYNLTYTPVGCSTPRPAEIVNLSAGLFSGCNTENVTGCETVSDCTAAGGGLDRWKVEGVLGYGGCLVGSLSAGGNTWTFYGVPR